MTNPIEYHFKAFKEKFSSEFLNWVLFERKLKELYEYCKNTNIEFEKICGDYINRESSEDWRAEEKVHETESEELIKNYYSTTKMYLIELTAQESTVEYSNLFRSIGQFIKRNRIKKVLDFGSGIGGLVIYLSCLGISCDYADIPGETWNYAKYRFQKEGVDASQVTEKDLAKLSPKYDLIVSLDCLEHLKPLPKYIALFNSALRTNGFLLAKNAFFGCGLHLSSNYKYDGLSTFNEMVENKGFVFKGQLITRLKRNFLVPDLFCKLLSSSSASGKKLIYLKR